MPLIAATIGFGESSRAFSSGLNTSAAANCAGAELVELLDVGPAAERLAGAGQHDCANGRVGGERLSNAASNAGDHAGAQSVHRRIVEGDNADVAVAGSGDEDRSRSPCPLRFLTAELE